MRTQFRLTAFIFLFLVPVFGKLTAQNATTYKPLQIAVINSLDFEDEQQGVTKLLNNKKTVDAEFKPLINEFTALQKKYDDLVKALQSPNTKYDADKADQAEKLLRDIKFKQENNQDRYQKRYYTLANPVYTAMGEAMKQWAMQKGYDVLLDVSKDDKGIIMWVDEQKINELTMDLIKHFNTVL